MVVEDAHMRTWIAKLVALAFLLLMPFEAMAQAPSGAATDQNLLEPQELDALVAPIALYPDPLLAEVLMASTYRFHAAWNPDYG